VPMGVLARGVLVLGCAALMGGCVTLAPNAPRSPQDPYERWNRGVYQFNDALDRGVVKPVARTYRRFLPQFARTGVSNFLANLHTPTIMFNDALQGKELAALEDLGRLLANTIFGIGGLRDPATNMGIPRNDEDFGQTLGKWGVHPGPFLELPLLGPSDLRDGPARIVDVFTYPPTYLRDPYASYGLWGLYLIDLRAGLLSFDDALANAYDPYMLIRDAYLRRRAYLVADGKVADDEPLIDPDASPDAPMP
jgi:phospholipid-binding lipoprotein MlaA